MIEGWTGRRAHPTSQFNNSCRSPNCGTGTETRWFRDSIDDLGFTEPTDTTSLLRETRRFTRRTDGFVTGDST